MRVLLVEDDLLVAGALQRSLERYCEVVLAANIADALRLVAEAGPDAVVSDYDLRDPHGRDGLWLLDRIDRPGLVLTGYDVTHGRHRVLRKPIAPAVLYEEIAQLLVDAKV